MPIDPNIALQYQPPQIQNPLDAATKAMSMQYFMQNAKRAAIENQVQQMNLGNTLAQNQALAQNTSVNPDGTVAINRQGVMSDLANMGRGNLIPQVSTQLGQYNLDALTNQHNTKIGLLSEYDGSPDSWAQVRAKAAASGLPDANNLPTQPPPLSTVHGWITNLAGVNAQLKSQANNIAQQNANNQAGQLKLALQKQKQTALQQAAQALNSTRQVPTNVNQARTDLYNTQKVADIYSGDLNKLTPQQVNLGLLEVSKIAAGKAPTSDEYKLIDQGTAQKIESGVQQFLANNPKASQQGAFAQVMKNYIGNVRQNALNTVNQYANATIGAYSPYLAPEDKQNLISGFINQTPYNSAAANASFAPTPGDGQVPGAPAQAQGQAPTQQPAYTPPKMGTTVVHGGLTYIATPQGWAPQPQAQAAR